MFFVGILNCNNDDKKTLQIPRYGIYCMAKIINEPEDKISFYPGSIGKVSFVWVIFTR